MEQKGFIFAAIQGIEDFFGIPFYLVVVIAVFVVTELYQYLKGNKEETFIELVKRLWRWIMELKDFFLNYPGKFTKNGTKGKKRESGKFN